MAATSGALPPPNFHQTLHEHLLSARSSKRVAAFAALERSPSARVLPLENIHLVQTTSRAGFRFSRRDLPPSLSPPKRACAPPHMRVPLRLGTEMGYRKQRSFYRNDFSVLL